MFWDRFIANVKCRFDQWLTFKINLFLSIVNTILQVFMWYFLSKIIDPSTLGYANIGYLPFILVGSLAIFIVDRVTVSLIDSFSRDKDMGLLKLSYLADIGVIEYFFINFFTELIFDFFIVIIPMVITFIFLIHFVEAGTFYFGIKNFLTMLIAFAIFIIGSLGFSLMSLGSLLYVKKGDPVSFIVTKLNEFFSGQIFPISVLPTFVLFVTKILPAAYIIIIWRETLFLNKTFFQLDVMILILAGLIINVIIFAIGIFIFHYGVNRAKIEGRWF